MRGPGTLRSRLFSWFVGAILMAMLTSATVHFTTGAESAYGAEGPARRIADHLALVWDDPEATRAFLVEVRDVTGFDVRLVRDPRHLGLRARRLAERGDVLVPDGPRRVLIPVMRGGVLAGGLDVEGLGTRAAGWTRWRLLLALLLVLAVLSAMAGGVAGQLARPLERLARAADRFGGGDLASRADVAGPGHRWIAREVRDVAVRFNRMADRLEATVRSQRELLGAISHELRSPLARAHVALEIARDRLGETSVERTPAAALDEVEKELGAIDSILGDLLDVTRAGLADLRKEPRAWAEWVTARVAEQGSTPPVSLRIDAPAAGLTFAFDPKLLERALHNVLVNARAHGHPSDQPLEVSVGVTSNATGSWARVTVRDRGSGFPEALLASAFEPFVRGDASRSRPSAGAGYGLGLAIVKRVVEAHGGCVFARNAPGGGAEVGFDLPIGSDNA